MAVTVEYIIILTGYCEYKGIQVGKVNITSGEWILFDRNGAELTRSKRLGNTSGIIISSVIGGLAGGETLRFLTLNKLLYVISDELGEMPVECEVSVPEDDQ